MEQVVTAGVVLALLVVAGVLLVRRPRHPVTVVLVVMAVANVLGPVAPDPLVNAIWVLGVLPLALLLIAFPDGRRGRGRRRLFDLTAAAIGGCVLLTLVPPESALAPVALPVAAVLGLLVIPAALLAVVWLVGLWWRSRGARRWRIGIVLSAGVVLVGMYTVMPLLVGLLTVLGVPSQASSPVSDAQAGLLFTLVPVAVGLSMLLEPVGRQVPALERAWPAMLAAAASLVVAGTIVGIGLALGAPSDGPAVVATTALGVGLAVWGVTALARRGHDIGSTGPDRAAAALAGLAERQSLATGSDGSADEAAAVVGEALGLRGLRLVALVDGRAESVGEWGELDARSTSRELRHSGELVGVMELVVHDDGVALDERVLDPLLPSLAAIVAAASLERRLAEAHREVRLARDAERARLRTDLHDELSPSIAGVRLALHAARAKLGASTHLTAAAGRAAPVAERAPIPGEGGLAEADALLERADGELARAGGVVRGIIEDLGPDDLVADGLVAAIRSRAADFMVPGRFDVAVDVPEPLPPLTAAVEVAALRVLSEAVCNAARHSEGTRCHVLLAPDGAGLRMTVIDDGLGLPRVRRPGLGLPSMQARTHAVGGTFIVEPAASKGTRIDAWFPADSP